MTQEEKEVLLKDLCARLPYHPIVYVDENLPRLKLGVATRVWEYVAVDKPCKPYLRPLSSMTEEEKTELFQLMGNGTDIQRIDFYLSHYFDFRCLIPMGLALEAPEGMYNIKEK